MRTHPRAAGAALAAVLLAAIGTGCTAGPEHELPICRLHPDLDVQIVREVERAGSVARAGIWLARPGSAPLYARGVDVPLPCASSIKTAYLVELFAQFAGRLDEPFPRAATIAVDAAHPAVAHFSAEQRATAVEHLGSASVRRVGEAMMTGRGVDNATYNIAANLVTAHLGGPRTLTERLHARGAPWRGLAVRRYMLADREATGDNEATARALGTVLEQLATASVDALPDDALAAARAIMAKPGDGDARRFTKGGSLNSYPAARIRSGYRTGPNGAVVWVVMLAQGDGDRSRSAEAGSRLAEAAQRIEALLLDAAP